MLSTLVIAEESRVQGDYFSFISTFARSPTLQMPKRKQDEQEHDSDSDIVRKTFYRVSRTGH